MNWLGSIAMLLLAALAALLPASAAATPNRASLPPLVLPEIEPKPIIDGTRVALVIGNSAYQNTTGWSALGNAGNDARYIKQQLENLPGPNARFDVTLAVNLTREQMVQVLADFKAKAAAADISLIYYAGHGFHFKSENYLVPVDASPRVSEHSLALEHIDFTEVVEAGKAKKLSLFFLDACRTTNAITELDDIDNNVAVATYFGGSNVQASSVFYATRAGQPAYDALPESSPASPFATGVLAVLRRDGVKLGDFYDLVSRTVVKATENKQEPVLAKRFNADFYFVPPTSQVRTAARTVQVQPSGPAGTGVFVPDDDMAPAMATTSAGSSGGYISAAPSFDWLSLDLDVLALFDNVIVVGDVLETHSVQLLHELSAQGDPDANYVLGIMYAEGLGVEEDVERALHFFELSANEDHPAAIYGEAWLFEKIFADEGMTPDAETYELIMQRYRYAHQQGFVRATIRLAELYADGIIDPAIDTSDLIREVWGEGAQFGHTRSMYELYNLGGEDKALYLEELRGLADDDHVEAALWLCMIDDYPFTIEEQVGRCFMAASGGKSPALRKLTTDLAHRPDVDIAPQQVQYWADIALASGELSAEDEATVRRLLDEKS